LFVVAAGTAVCLDFLDRRGRPRAFAGNAHDQPGLRRVLGRAKQIGLRPTDGPSTTARPKYRAQFHAPIVASPERPGRRSAERGYPAHVTREPDELRAALRNDLTAAMKARDSDVVTALRTAIAAIDNAGAVEATEKTAAATSEHFAGAHVGLGATEVERRSLSAHDIREILRAQQTEHTTHADHYEALGQSDAADRLRRQADALRRYVSD
jgi:uncharacterized protein YqeY